jgi:hypothetical protein
MVSQGKVDLWFLEEVLGLALRIPGDTKDRRLGEPSMKIYLAALVALWKIRRSLGVNPHEASPRGIATLGHINRLRVSKHTRARATFEDRARNTILDGYDSTQLDEILAGMWRRTTAPEIWLRTTVDFLLGHMMLLRGEGRASAELPDLFSVHIESEGAVGARALVLIMR